MMYRTEIRLTTEQLESLKQLVVREGKSVAELIRLSVDSMLRSAGIRDPDKQYRKAIAAAGKLQSGPQDLAKEHDRYLAEAFE
jgi:Arc/MetJ-type ribon-helix-helix transcriptional regulator